MRESESVGLFFIKYLFLMDLLITEVLHNNL